MKKKSSDTERIAEMAESGQDISEHFTGNFIAKQRVNIDFPLDLLKQIDAECRRIGVTRQSWIKIVCDEKLRETQVSRLQIA